MTPNTEKANVPHRGARLYELDATRGLAALVVFLSHALFFVGPLERESTVLRIINGLLKRLLDGGAAVDYFFVLSGFVLALPFIDESRRTLSVPEFIVRRIVRIMPTYWVALAAALAIRAYVNGLGLAEQNPSIILMDWGKPLSLNDIASHVWLIFKDFDVRLINGPIWSLSVEMQISLLLPMIIAVLGVRQSPAGGLTILAISLFISARTSGALLFLPMFVAGVLLARYQHALVERFRALSSSAAGFVLILACILFWNRSLQSIWGFPDPRQEWLSGAGSTLFILMVLANRMPQWFLDNPVCKSLGEISYSLYLMHLPLLQAAVIFMRAHGWVGWTVILVAAILSIFGSVLLHRTVELPSLEWGRRVSRWRVWARDSVPRASAL